MGSPAPKAARPGQRGVGGPSTGAASLRPGPSLGIGPTIIEGRWPDAAPEAPTADVVVRHPVAYNVPDLRAFAAALTAHARHRVVVELTAEHPTAWTSPYWAAPHGLTQPDHPVAGDAVAVLSDLGLDVHQERWRRGYQMIGETGDEALLRITRRLCLPPDRHDELREALASTPPPADREVVTLWW